MAFIGSQGSGGTIASPTGDQIMGANFSSSAINAPGNYRDVFGFDNAPDSTNLPQIYEREVTIYGNRTLMGFLRMIGSEMPTNSQQIRWAEQKRLHVFYNNVYRTGADTSVLKIKAQDGAATGDGSNTTGDLTDHSIRQNDKILVGNSESHTSTAAELFIVTAVSGADITVAAYGGTTDTILDTLTDATGADPQVGTSTQQLNVLVIGSEFGKGSDSRSQIVQPEYSTYTNSTVIMRDTYAVNGTDANQIGWVEIADENGVQGKYWYLKGKSETMTRWEDYLELSLLEDKKASSNLLPASTSTNPTGTAKGGDIAGSGSEGFFEAVENRGNIFTGTFSDSNPTAAEFRNDALDVIVRQLDKEGNIEENVLYLNRNESLAFDDGMALQSNNGANNVAWGLFNNSESMGLSLGFQSVRRGSYDFYKKDWKYLNQVDGRGSFGGIKGAGIPMGTKSVYDQYGANLMMPFATINYLAGPHHSRKNQSWVHGGQAPTPTSGLDAMTIEFLTERCICVKGANNFFLFK